MQSFHRTLNVAQEQTANSLNPVRSALSCSYRSESAEQFGKAQSDNSLIKSTGSGDKRTTFYEDSEPEHLKQYVGISFTNAWL